MIARIFGAALALLALAGVADAQFAAQRAWGGIAGGTANAPTITVPNVTALTNVLHVPVMFQPSAANTGATTLNLSGLGAQPVKKPTTSGLAALTGNELVSGQPAIVVWDGTEYVLQPSAFGGTPVTTDYNTAGTYSYSVPAGTTRLFVEECGGGGGGGGAQLSGGATNGGVGGTSSFNGVTVIGGGGGGSVLGTSPTNGGAGGTGGTGSASRTPGGTGFPAPILVSGSVSGIASTSGAGGASAMGPGAPSSLAGGLIGGQCAGGSGGTALINTLTGASGGGGGETAVFWVGPPLSSSYTAVVGSGGTAGTGSAVGGTGGSGRVRVTAFFN